jgi:hypothetical protein
MFWFITDTTTKASVSGVKAQWNVTPATITQSGITTVTSGTVKYSATLADVSNPASQNASNSYVQLTNTDNFAADLANQTVVIDANSISKTTTTLNSGFYEDTADCLSVSASNINGSAGAVTGDFYDVDGVTAISKLDIYTDSTDSSISESNRKQSDGSDWDSNAVLSANDLQVYHGEICYPKNINFSGANGVNANRNYTTLQTGDKYIILYYSAAGT